MARSRTTKKERSAASTLDAGGSSWTSRLLALLLCLLAMALAAVVYYNTLDNPFVHVDRCHGVGTHSIRDLGHPPGRVGGVSGGGDESVRGGWAGNLRAIVTGDLPRPAGWRGGCEEGAPGPCGGWLVTLSYAVDHHFWELEPFGYHLSNLVLHTIDVALLFMLGMGLSRDRRMLAGRPLAGGQPGAAFACAALLAVHPVLSEAVGSTSGRSELLGTGFLLLAFLALRSFLVGGGRLWLVPGFAAFALALASNETAVMLPFLLLAWERLLAAGAPLERRLLLLRFHLPFVAFVMLAWSGRIVACLLLEGRAYQDLLSKLLMGALVLWRYLLLLVWPASLSIVHQVPSFSSLRDPAMLVAVAGILVLCGCLLLLRRHQPLAVFGVIWFLLLLVPSHLMSVGAAMAEHRLYGASCGFFLVFAAAWGMLRDRPVEYLSRHRLIASGLLISLLLVLGVLTVTRNRVWSDPVALWRDAVMKAPHAWAAQYGLAEALRAEGRCAEAIPVLERAINIQADRLRPYLDRGICLVQEGQAEEARRMFLAARHVDSSSPEPYNQLGALAIISEEPRQAASWFAEAIRHDPLNLIARWQLVHLYEGPLDDPEQALALCREIRTIAPDTPGISDCIERNHGRPQIVPTTTGGPLSISSPNVHRSLTLVPWYDNEPGRRSRAG